VGGHTSAGGRRGVRRPPPIADAGPDAACRRVDPEPGRLGVRAHARPEAPARLLPSGDASFLLQGADRELLVPDAKHRLALWTSRVWPGAVVVDGEIVGTWRRAGRLVTIAAWKRLSRAARQAVEAEAAALPLPDVRRPPAVQWKD
jgi:hypothetical protein